MGYINFSENLTYLIPLSILKMMSRSQKNLSALKVVSKCIYLSFEKIHQPGSKKSYSYYMTFTLKIRSMSPISKPVLNMSQ